MSRVHVSTTEAALKDLLSVTMINAYSYNCNCSNVRLVSLSQTYRNKQLET